MITFTVNGNKHEFSGDPSTPVLWYLRDELNLTGPKFGCGMAQCGACTVHIDGRQPFEAMPLSVPGDISAAAFFLVAASIVPDSEVFLNGIGLNPERTGIVEITISSHVLFLGIYQKRTKNSQ